MNILMSVEARRPPSSAPRGSCITIWPPITHSSLHPSICSPLNSLPPSPSDQSHLPASPWTHSLTLHSHSDLHLWQRHLTHLTRLFFLLSTHTSWIKSESTTASVCASYWDTANHVHDGRGGVQVRAETYGLVKQSRLLPGAQSIASSFIMINVSEFTLCTSVTAMCVRLMSST